MNKLATILFFSIFVCFHAIGQETFSEYRRSQACSERLFEKMEDIQSSLIGPEQIRGYVGGYSDQAINQRIRVHEKLRNELRSLSMEDCLQPALLASLNLDVHLHSKARIFSLYRDGRISRTELGRQIDEEIDRYEAINTQLLLDNKDHLVRIKLELKGLAIGYIQDALIDAGFAVKRSKQFDLATARALNSFILALQKDKDYWGQGWSDPADGRYTEKFSRHIHSKLAGRSNNLIVIRAVDALDFLMEQDALPKAIARTSSPLSPFNKYSTQDRPVVAPPRGAPVRDERGLQRYPVSPSGKGDESGDKIVAALFIPAFQGFALEWADEIYCEFVFEGDFLPCQEDAKALIEGYENEYGWLAIASNIVGVLLSPAGLIFVFFLAGTTKSSWEAFKGGFTAEAIEGGLSAAGIYNTHGAFPGGEYFVLMTAAAGLVTGIVAASRVKRK
ncbi:hypothetical protein [Hyphomonas atlantica corrig.]|uniref:hypothetical protein n=1 Tax=Hyphomonas atlantica TaxID=1280948 RepID=UPI002354EE70|nr:hypothetical protein [Hyphomonas atlantica]